MITKTGKVGKYYETTYYFQQEYIKWNYLGIPYYYSVIHIAKDDNNVVNNKYNIMNLFFKGRAECDTISKYVKQYTTEELWKQGLVGLEIFVQITNSTPEILRNITFKKIISLSNSEDDYELDEDINAHLSGVGDSYLNTINIPLEKIYENGDLFKFYFQPDSGIFAKDLECIVPLSSLGYSNFEMEFRETMTVPDGLPAKDTKNTMTNFVDYVFSNKLFTMGTMTYDIHIQMSGFQSTINTIYEKENSFYHNQTNETSNVSSLFLVLMRIKTTTFNVIYPTQQTVYPSVTTNYLSFVNSTMPA